MVKKRNVAIGIIFNQQNQILISRRPSHADQGGLWEFPGGKIDQHESVYQALCRELQEEVGIEVVKAEPFMNISHAYQNYCVILHTWKVLKFFGEPKGWEGQEIKWIDVNNLLNYSFPMANRSLVQSIIDNNLIQN